jgi:uncharacterized membrane protein
MTSPRHLLIDWIEGGRIDPAKTTSALFVAEVYPAPATWRRFLDRLLLWLGTLLAAAGVVYFFAYNWNDLGRMAKFALAQAFIVAALIAIWRIGIDRIAGKAVLFAAAVFVGVLLALIGQTYQTGADTFELFAVWALFVLPWVVVGRFAALWLFWIALLNTAAYFYHATFGGLFGFAFSGTGLLWVLLGLNTLALAIWETVAVRIGHRHEWALRILATVSGTMATALAMHFFIDWSRVSPLALVAWFAWIAAAYVVYRVVMRDVFMLAGGVLSVIVVVTSMFIRLVPGWGDAGALLVIGLVVIGLSAVGGWWLKRVVKETRS